MKIINCELPRPCKIFHDFKHTSWSKNVQRPESFCTSSRIRSKTWARQDFEFETTNKRFSHQIIKLEGGHKKQTTQPYFGRPKNKSTPSNNSVLIKFVKPMPLSSKLLKPFEFLFGGELKVAVCSFACTLGSCQNGPQSNLTVLRQGCGLEVLSLGPLGTPSWLGRWIRRVTCVTQIIDGWQNAMIIHGRTAESLLYKILLTVFDQLEIKFYMLKMGKIYDDSDLSSTTSKLKSQCLLLGIC